MLQFIIKALLSGLIVATVATRRPALSRLRRPRRLAAAGFAAGHDLALARHA